MSDDDRLLDLFSVWHRDFEGGRERPAEDYCGDCPELAAELRLQIDAFRHLNRLARSSGGRTGATVSVSVGRVATSAAESSPGPAGQDTQPTGGAPPLASRAAAPPTVPGYLVLEEIGRGGMGVVYKARQTSLGRLVALKMILAPEYASEREVARFRTEGQAVARLQHRNIVQIFEVGEHQGHPYCALEFCPEGSLDKKLAGHPIDSGEAGRLVEVLARAVHAAHQARVIHRDLKPANVLLALEPQAATVAGHRPSLAGLVPKVSDFGLAKRLDEAGQTGTGEVLGTPSYMAPEQAEGRKNVGAAADIYALGAILYECLTGRPPFHASTPMETILQVLHEEPLAVRLLQPRAPADLSTICHKCLEKDPGKRYATAGELADDLGRFAEGRPIKARPVRPLGRAWRWCRRRPAIACLLLLSLALTLAGASGVLWQWRKARLHSDRAEENFRRSRAAVDDLFTLVSEEELLHQPGMKPLRERLLRRALKYYHEFTSGRDDDLSLRQDLALATYRVGVINDELNVPDEAIASYRRARRLQERLAAEQPADASYRADLARTCNNLGHAEQAVGDSKAALEELTLSRALAERLVEEHPGNPKYRTQLARTYLNLAGLHKSLGRSAERARLCDRAVEILEGLNGQPREGAEYRQALAAAYEAQSACQPFVQARQTMARAVAIQERLVSERPSDGGRQRRLGLMYLGQALDERERGVRERSIPLFQRVLDIQERLYSREPDVAQLQRDLGLTCDQMAFAMSRVGQPAKALPLYERALGLYRPLIRVNPKDVEARNFEAMILNGIALAYRDLNRPEDSQKTFAQALSIQGQLVQEFPRHTKHRMDWAGTNYNLARMLTKFKQPREAVASFRQARAIWDQMAKEDPGDPRLKHLTTMAEVQIGELLLEVGQPGEAVQILQEARTRSQVLVG